MSDTKIGMSSHSGLSAFGPMHTSVPTVDLVEQRQPGQLRGHELDAVPVRQLLAGHAHGRHRAVVAGLGQAVGGQLVDVARRTAPRAPGAGRGSSPGRRRGRTAAGAHQVVAAPRCRRPAAVAVEPARELLERLGVVVGADPGVDPVVPAVQAAQQVVAVDVAVGQQRAPVRAPPVEHRVVVAPPDEHQVDALDHRADGRAVGDLAPRRHLHRASFASPLEARPRWIGPPLPVSVTGSILSPTTRSGTTTCGTHEVSGHRIGHMDYGPEDSFQVRGALNERFPTGCEESGSPSRRCWRCAPAPWPSELRPRPRRLEQPSPARSPRGPSPTPASPMPVRRTP